VSARDDLGFLGEEFLTWLWWRIETGGGEFELAGDRVVGVSLDDFLMFAPHDGDEVEPTLRKGGPSRSLEARTALRDGRRLRRARFVIAEPQRSFGVTIDGPTLQLGSIRLPPDPEDAGSPAERALERIDGFRTVAAIVGELYRRFLHERLRGDYLARGAAPQATWMAGG
jgi:hypothetical protein